jgi:hypothetical protein
MRSYASALISLLTLSSAPSYAQIAEADCVMFGFDAKRDSPHVEILDYKYGSSGVEGTFAEPGKPVRQGWGVAQAGLKGDRLFVRWKNKETGQVFTEDVALKGHLPAYNKTPCEIFFAIKRNQLYVFLLTQEPRPPDWPSVDTNSNPIVTDYLKAFVLYPYGRPTVD